jgi:hypothetical protein
MTALDSYEKGVAQILRELGISKIFGEREPFQEKSSC